jgi:multicomponent Na+:H+ antiporter subunit F
MIELSTTIALVLLGIGMACAIARVVLGPTLADRVLGLDVATTLGVGITAVFATRTGYFLYLDIAVTLALMAFLSTAAFARYVFGTVAK